MESSIPLPHPQPRRSFAPISSIGKGRFPFKPGTDTREGSTGTGKPCGAPHTTLLCPLPLFSGRGPSRVAVLAAEPAVPRNSSTAEGRGTGQGGLHVPPLPFLESLTSKTSKVISKPSSARRRQGNPSVGLGEERGGSSGHGSHGTAPGPGGEGDTKLPLRPPAHGAARRAQRTDGHHSLHARDHHVQPSFPRGIRAARAQPAPPDRGTGHRVTPPCRGHCRARRKPPFRRELPRQNGAAAAFK